MLFSRRTPADLSENPLAAALRARSEPYVDLTVSNPSAAGLSPSEEELRGALSPAGSAAYRPDPRGLASAREAVSASYAARGADIHPDHIFLTASTSEAYSFLFKLLADPGDALLVPEPSYPLFEHLVRLEALSAVPYRLRLPPPEHRWRLDFATIERGLDGGARAVLSVHPNNPTGSFVSGDDRRRLLALLDPGRHALVSDEVFLDFAVEGGADPAAPAASARGGPLAFSLGGISKSCALPQMKLAWIAIGGERAAAAAAADRLELIADTYLSVGTPVQLALPRLFEIGFRAGERIRERLRGNLAALDATLARIPGSSRLPVEAGWSAVVRLAAGNGDPAGMLLRDAGVLVQPGWFFDFAEDDVVVVSLLPEPAEFGSGWERIVAALS
ncbi:MAG TPA: pyridoxal phosphate-dependent aminotransferase [Thermoanaerobaculia bacterium]|nr:pyridoxal phosphate-dependent aminotransferase [Thermoanaerobaculia bacterium]